MPDWLPRETDEHTTSRHALQEESSGGFYALLCPSCGSRFVSSHGVPHGCECGQVMIFYGNSLFAWPGTVFPLWSIPDNAFWRHAHASAPEAEPKAATPTDSTSGDRFLPAFMSALAATVLFVVLGVATGAWFFLALTLWGVAVSTSLLIFGAVTRR